MANHTFIGPFIRHGRSLIRHDLGEGGESDVAVRVPYPLCSSSSTLNQHQCQTTEMLRHHARVKAVEH